MTRPERVVSVTLGLIGIGAVAGAVSGALIPLAVVLLTGSPGNVVAPGLGRLMALGAGFGAVVGTLAAPALAWGLLRHVSLGKAMLWGSTGTVVGAVVGELLAPFNPYTRVIPGVIAGGMLGVVAASIALRVRSARGHDRTPVTGPPNERPR